MDVVAFSELQLRGKAVVDTWLRRGTSRALLLRRRGAEDLVLTTAGRAAEANDALSITTKMLAALVQYDKHITDAAAAVASTVFPWVAFLSPQETQEFVRDLITTATAAESLNNPAPLAQLVTAWRHTAEILADPALAQTLSADSTGDYGPVAPEDHPA